MISTFNIISSLRKVSALDLDKTVVGKLKDAIVNIRISRAVYLEFFSLGDLLKGTLLLSAIREAFPNLKIYIRIVEEYFDYEDILQDIECRFSISCIDKLPDDVFRIGVFDTKVDAYASQPNKFDAIFPTYFLAPLHKSGRSENRSKIRRVLGIKPKEKVLVIGNFSSLQLDQLKLEHIVQPSIRQDFQDTHQARYIPWDDLHILINLAIDEKYFDRLLLVPRNVHEEHDTLYNFRNHHSIVLDSQDNQLTLDRPVIILPAKGILRSVYMIADVSLVMGFHNVLEPFLCYSRNRTFCIDSPSKAPNRFLFDCGNRLKIIRAIKCIPSGKEGIQELLKLMSGCDWQPKSNLYSNDPLYKSSLQLSIQHLRVIFCAIQGSKHA